jgi:hypothetical protein
MYDPAELAGVEERYRQGNPSLGRALEIVARHWADGARDEGTIIRLLFLIWYRVVEPPALTGLPVEYAGPSFEGVFESAGGEAAASPLVLWAVGKMAEVAPWAIGREDEWRETGSRLLDRARQSSPGIAAKAFEGMGAAGDYLRHLLVGT